MATEHTLHLPLHLLSFFYFLYLNILLCGSEGECVRVCVCVYVCVSKCISVHFLVCFSQSVNRDLCEALHWLTVHYWFFIFSVLLNVPTLWLPWRPHPFGPPSLSLSLSLICVISLHSVVFQLVFGDVLHLVIFRILLLLSCLVISPSLCFSVFLLSKRYVFFG